MAGFTEKIDIRLLQNYGVSSAFYEHVMNQINDLINDGTGFLQGTTNAAPLRLN